MKREYAKLLAVLQAYALIATGVRLICTNHVRAAWPFRRGLVVPGRMAMQCEGSLCRCAEEL